MNKQFILLDEVPVLAYSIRALEAARSIGEIVIVTREEDIPAVNEIVKEYGFKKVSQIVAGGETRQKSVMFGVAACCGLAQYYCIHDGARPLVTPEAVDRCCECAFEHKAAALAVKVKDTVKKVKDGIIIDTPERASLYLCQTPQVFECEMYKKAAFYAAVNGSDFTDDCQLIEKIGEKVAVCEGEYSNIKITTREDARIAGAFFSEE